MNNKAIFAVISLAAILADQMTKVLVRLNFSIGKSVPVIYNIFHITYITNTGSAFGLFRGFNSIFIIISIFIISLIAYYFYVNYIKNGNGNKNEKIELILLALLLAGVIGNLIDRVLFGQVTDFLDFRIWPVFNLADSLVTISAVWLAGHYRNKN